MLDSDYEGDYNIKKLAYIGINAINYLHARKMLHSITSDIDCTDPLETIFNADKLALAIQYNQMEPAVLKRNIISDNLNDDEIELLLAII